MYHTVVRILILVGILTFLLSCGSSKKLTFIPLTDLENINIRTEPITYTSEDQRFSIKGVKFYFPAPISWVSIDNEQKNILLHYASSYAKNGTVVYYNLENNQVLWAIKSNATKGCIEDNYCVLAADDKQIGVAKDRAKFYGNVPPRQFYFPL